MENIFRKISIATVCALTIAVSQVNANIEDRATDMVSHILISKQEKPLETHMRYTRYFKEDDVLFKTLGDFAFNVEQEKISKADCLKKLISKLQELNLNSKYKAFFAEVSKMTVAPVKDNASSKKASTKKAESTDSKKAAPKEVVAQQKKRGLFNGLFRKK